VNRDGKLDLLENKPELVQKINENEDLTSEEYKTILADLKKTKLKDELNIVPENLFDEEIEGTFAHSRKKKAEAQENLKSLQTKLEVAKATGDTTEIGDISTEIQKVNGDIEEYKKNMDQFVDVFDNTIKRQRGVVEDYQKKVVEASKSKVEKISKEIDETIQNIGKGAPAHHGINRASTVPNVDISK
jgi:flagellar biosynthesis chaperone FliJ